MNCRHEIPNYDMILWYQRSHIDTELKLIGYVYFEQMTIEKSFKNFFNVSGNGKKYSTLHLLQLRASEDSTVYFCAAYYHSFAESSFIKQTPELLCKSTESVTINCSHSGTVFNMIVWYKQLRNGRMLLMGYLYRTNINTEPEFQEKLDLEGNGATNSSLTLKRLSQDDSAVYFCAAQTSQ
ncbi:hypothetical protein DNTS_014430 [Danionella cerebrum]|uniref:Ig-like domain-containing protein n=1 Tax=Danionella cerebrum TaxID=2873325 RepID=A0A553MXL1_9TELE|nr:hypothetical protein DNTS_014430 [Danionella translucida]